MCVSNNTRLGQTIYITDNLPHHLQEKTRKKVREEWLPEVLEKLEKLLVANGGGDGYLVGNEVRGGHQVYLRYYPARYCNIVTQHCLVTREQQGRESGFPPPSIT